nr:RNA-directed DNA polymerase, eukaryota [Tanacetum cinerariifolium]
FPDSLDAKGLWNVCVNYGRLVDSFIAYNALKEKDLNDNLNNVVQELNEEKVKATKLSDEEQVIVEEEVKIVNPHIPSTVDVSSEDNRPLGFKNMKRNPSHTSKCSTSFTKHHKKNIKAKSTLWNKLIDFMQHHNGKYILLGDWNVVHCENKRFGSILSRLEADQFNAFIDSSGLLDLHIEGRLFTWMNKAGSMPHGSNSSFFTLTPKVSNLIFIKDFWPISLIGIHYKIIAEVLAIRFSKVIDKIVSHEQSAFIAGRQILDGVGVSNEDVSSMARDSSCASGSFPLIEPSFRRGDLTLIKSVLGILGIYYLSIFKAPELVLKDLERSRGSFFWGSTIDNKKMAWIKWSNILPSFDKGGLNIDSLKSFNFALLQKWRWRMYNRLYHLEQEKDCLIIDRFDNDNWKWNWSRDNIGVRNSASLRDLISNIEDVDLNMEEDSCVWVLSFNGSFSVGDTRCLIDAKLFPSSTTPTYWDKVLPWKVIIFLWRAALDRLPNCLNLSCRGLDIHFILCLMCIGNVESIAHTFFGCVVAFGIWRMIGIWCDISVPIFTSFAHMRSWLQSRRGSKQENHRLFVIFASLCWWLWRYRNSVTFSPHPMRKSDIFDNIHMSSFSWLTHRGNMSCSCVDWLKAPMCFTVAFLCTLVLAPWVPDSILCIINDGLQSIRQNYKMVDCACGLEAVIRTSWTNRNPGRRFYGCPTPSPTCVNFLWWYDPLMCQRSVQIIPGLLRSHNEIKEILAMVEKSDASC